VRGSSHDGKPRPSLFDGCSRSKPCRLLRQPEMGEALSRMRFGTFGSLIPAKATHANGGEGESHARVIDCDEPRTKSVSLYRTYKMYQIDSAAVAVGAYAGSSSGGSLNLLEGGDARLALPAAESRRRPAIRINHLTEVRLTITASQSPAGLCLTSERRAEGLSESY
jgi:hypothetical protein